MPRVAKPQRTDLNTKVPAVAAPGQPYGQAGAELTAQKAVPMAAGPPVPPPTAPQPQGPPQGSPTPPMPGQMGSLFDPTNRPQEPVTAGAASGPGPGSEALGVSSDSNPAINAVRAAYLQYPVDGLREILENLDKQNG